MRQGFAWAAEGRFKREVYLLTQVPLFNPMLRLYTALPSFKASLRAVSGAAAIYLYDNQIVKIEGLFACRSVLACLSLSLSLLPPTPSPF